MRASGHEGLGRLLIGAAQDQPIVEHEPGRPFDPPRGPKLLEAEALTMPDATDGEHVPGREGRPLREPDVHLEPAERARERNRHPGQKRQVGALREPHRETLHRRPARPEQCGRSLRGERERGALVELDADVELLALAEGHQGRGEKGDRGGTPVDDPLEAPRRDRPDAPVASNANCRLVPGSDARAHDAKRRGSTSS